MNKFNFQWLFARCIPSFLVLAFASCASLSPRDATYKSLEQTRLEEFRVREAYIGDVLSFLVQASRERDTEFTKGVGIIFMDPEGVSEPVPGKPGEDPFGFSASTRLRHSTPLITLELRNVTLKEVLDAVCDVAGVEWRIDENGILLLEPLPPASLSSHAREFRLEVKEFDHHIDWRVGERRMFELTLQGVDLFYEGDAELKMIESGENKTRFSSHFNLTPEAEGDYQVGPFTVELYGVPLVSNVLTFEILPQWDGNPVAAFRVDKKEITLGESVTLALEMISKEKRKDKAWLDSLDGEFDVLTSGAGASSGKTKLGWTKYSQVYSWKIRPLKPGPFVVSPDRFSSFPEHVDARPITVDVVQETP